MRACFLASFSFRFSESFCLGFVVMIDWSGGSVEEEDVDAVTVVDDAPASDVVDVVEACCVVMSDVVDAIITTGGVLNRPTGAHP